MERHFKTLGIFHIIYGSLSIIGFIILSTLISTLLPFILEEVDESATAIIETIIPFVKIIIFVLIGFVPLMSIIGGIGLANQKQWGLIVAMVAGCLSLLSFPVGTALGVYTIWVFTQQPK